MADEENVLTPVDSDDEGYTREGNLWVKVIDPGDGSRPSVFKGGTKREVAAKIEESYRQAAKRLRSQELQIKLGQGVVEPDPYEAPQEFKPRQLSAEEKSQIATRILDPQRAPEAVRLMIEAELGAPLDKIRSTLNQGVKNEARQQARDVASQFVAKHPEFEPCAENDRNMIAYLAKRKMAYSLKNLEIAFEDLQGHWILRPEAGNTDVPVQHTDAPPPNPAPSQAARPRSASVAMDDRASSVPRGTRATPTLTGPSLDELDRMSADQFEAWAANPANAAHYERLVAARQSRR